MTSPSDRSPTPQPTDRCRYCNITRARHAQDAQSGSAGVHEFDQDIWAGAGLSRKLVCSTSGHLSYVYGQGATFEPPRLSHVQEYMLDPQRTAEDSMRDWDQRFWAPARLVCDACTPPGLLRELQRLRAESPGPLGTTGPWYCAKCGMMRSGGV